MLTFFTPDIGPRTLSYIHDSSSLPFFAISMIIDINKRILNYLDYLRGKDEDSIVKQALQISTDLRHNGKTTFYSNLMKMVDYYDLNYDFSCNSLSDSIVNRYIGIMKNKYVSCWNQTLQQSHKLSFYCTIKDYYSPSPYLVLTRKNPSIKALVRFRISSHQLRIKTGRYENIPRNERICHFCTSNKIEDENHFLLDCKAYSQIRDIFFSRFVEDVNTRQKPSFSFPEL